MKCVRFSQLFLIIFIIFFIFVSQSEAACVHIGRTLKQGMVGDDIQLLQKFLNSDKRTMVAITGLGSPGKESRVFGKATLAAVKKFQDLHKETVLVPAGLKTASGIVGVLSRGVIAEESCADKSSGTTGVAKSPAFGVKASTQIATSSPVLSADEQFAQNLAAIKKRLEESVQKMRASATTNQTITTPVLTGETAHSGSTSSYVNLSDESKLLTAVTKYSNNSVSTVGGSPAIEAIAPTQPLPGLTLSLIGSGFTRNDNIRIGELRFTPLQVNASGTLATVLLPMTLTPGEQQIEISNTYGRTPTYVMTVKARDTITSSPIITSYTPDSGNIGTTITLTGRNLGAVNDIFSTTKIIKGIPSVGGQTVSFVLQAADELLGRDGRLPSYLPFSIAISNENGLSDPINFIIK